MTKVTSPLQVKSHIGRDLLQSAALFKHEWQVDQYGAPAVRDDIAAIKFTVANVMLKVIDRAIQVHGALGVTDDTILAYWYRHERAARIYDGADEVHKTSLGRRLLRTRKN